jgi:SapC
VLEYEADLIRTQQMCDLLAKLDVLRPFGAQAISKSGAITNLAGMYRVEEQLLERLKADDLRMLIGKGVMSRLYAHMISLDNLGALLDRQPA